MNGIDVDYQVWVHTSEGEVIPQSTAPATIERMLGLLAPAPGAAVLEIGTGSGYTGAVLSHLVGDSGRVVSLDVDADLVIRARGLHASANHRNIEVHVHNGFQGWAPGAPYDAVIGWTTAPVLPRAWVEQAAPTAVLVAPVKIAEIAHANAVILCTLHQGAPVNPALHPGSFIDMHHEVIEELGRPVRFVDSELRDDAGSAWWLSATALRDHAMRESATALLEQIRLAEPVTGFLPQDRQTMESFAAFVLSTTTSPGSTGGPGLGRCIGVVHAQGAAFVTSHGHLLAAGGTEAVEELGELRRQWQHRGRPRLQDLEVVLTEVAEGWAVRAQCGA
ncbi:MULTISPECIES: methyltransferase domain-containing protein [unclassified Crossiella]|uniref:protein-L-isoaspartate O-methyltransferase family protein n=1 Tax=unclassified Crossiella TaxID=2620835 RepID=UPI001FFF0950|nr:MULTISPECIES: methyltransferase domain-containing protein [unclassified Crossiella]MCK2245230.1 methyltransferase domain-containing protein [Crossiella sp. S99.2]MCK2258848.1 methyltransferase domain-containing protein [Crossiella sp. S99.1]